MFPASFHPLIGSWFNRRYGTPTAVQEEAWPFAARGENLLAIAPTGNGKTLTAFLAAISRFVDESWNAKELCCLYVSPLKALNEDVRRNLLEPLEELKTLAEGEGAAFMSGKEFPAIRVETRSGDTPQSARRRFLISPPSILALTPESLAILLINPRARALLSGIKLLVLDELHAVMGTKRGAFLSCQAARLALCAAREGRSFQRIALSATVNPPESAAEFAGTGRICSPRAEKNIEFRVEFPVEETEHGENRYGRRYTALISFILERVEKLRGAGGGTLLAFTDSRRRAERIAFLVNQAAGERLCLCHHGSLSKEVRREVELALVSGTVSCVAATSSLELGIDIGSIGEVLLAGSVSSCVQTLQRIGRAGHGVGQTSRAVMIPFYGTELAVAAALAEAVSAREIEILRPIKNPLDILAQIILALVLEESRNASDIYDTVRAFPVYADLKRSAFDGVLAMLSGKTDGNTRLRELPARLYLDIDGRYHAAKGTAALLYMSGGVIPNRGLYSMRLADGTRIGELDEEFVFERRPGDRFDFGSRSWKILEIGAEAVTVSPASEDADFQPFWKTDVPFRSPVLTQRLLELFERYEKKRETAGAGSLSTEAAGALAELLEKQRMAAGLPGFSRIPVEIIDNQARTDSFQIVVHSFRGGAVHYPLALAAAEILEETAGFRVEAIPGDNAVLLILPRAGYSRDGVEELVRKMFLRLSRDGENSFLKRLVPSGVFGAAFREAAECSLILPRGNFGRRTPLWITRQKSRRLYDKVASLPDFPAAAEALRSCLDDRFDMEAFRTLLDGLSSGEIRVDFFHSTSPSPFSRELVWKETNAFMYEYDDRPDLLGKTGGPLADAAVAAALADPVRRPSIGTELAGEFAAKIRREKPGWAPEDAIGLAEWVRERIAVIESEWRVLLDALPAGLRKEVEHDRSLGGRLSKTKIGGTAGVIIHAENEENPLKRLAEWLRCEGPVSASRAAEIFGPKAPTVLDALVREGEVVSEITIGDETGLYCDAENFTLLMRIARKKARPRIVEQPAALLAPFLALRQGAAGNARPDIAGAAGILSCWPAPAALWETEIFPARGIRPETIDVLLQDARLLWFGCGKERCGFCVPDEWELVRGAVNSGDRQTGAGTAIAAFCSNFRNFWEIRDELLRLGFLSGPGNTGAAALIWDAAWQGLISSDSFEAPRRVLGAADRAILPRYSPGRGFSVPHALREKWRGGAPVPGNWFSLDGDEETELSALEEDELNQDRVRLLLKRWGVLARPMLEREISAFSWSSLLPAMRRMELSGELVSGRFFGGIRSLQFASPSIGAELEEAENFNGVYWMNAADPSSPAGLEVDGLDPRFPPRSVHTRFCFCGRELAARSLRNGRELEIYLSPGCDCASLIPRFAAAPRTRPVHPVRKITIETINRKPAAASPWAEIFIQAGFIADRGKLFLW
jgi:ATP-dependent Lhr-like helicase